MSTGHLVKPYEEIMVSFKTHDKPKSPPPLRENQPPYPKLCYGYINGM